MAISLNLLLAGVATGSALAGPPLGNCVLSPLIVFMQKPVPVPNKVARSCAMRSLVASKRPANKSTVLHRI
jgi:hypothetical protein